MALRDHKPVPESEMEVVSCRQSICEMIRQIYHMVDDEEVKLKLRIASSMGKSMSRKLSEYKKNWYWNEWALNPAGFRSYHKRFLKPINVLMIAYDDFANTMYRFWLCAKKLGLNAIAVKGVSHPFKYPYQAPLHPSLMNQPISSAPLTVLSPGLEYLIKSANVIHLFASTYPLCAAKWKNHPVVIQHGGTYYRQHPKECNGLFNQLAHKTVIQCPDLLGLGAKNESLIYYPVDTTFIQPDFSKKGEKLVVGHFPSNPKVKGSEKILEVVNQLIEKGYDIEFHGPGGKDKWPLISWAKNLERFIKCDVIVETLSPHQNGKPFGEWGNTALEAAASGCIIISNCTHQDIYQKEYGSLGIHVANDKDALKAELVRLSMLNDDELLKEKKACRKWAEEKHSIPATAERLWDKVYSDFF